MVFGMVPCIQTAVIVRAVPTIHAAMTVRMVPSVQTAAVVPVSVPSCTVVAHPAIARGHSVAVVEGTVASCKPMGAGMKASRDAAATMFEGAVVVITEAAMIDDGDAIRNVGCAAERNGPSTPFGRPPGEAPSEAGKHANGDRGIKANSHCGNHADRGSSNDIAGISSDETSPDNPRVVIGDIDHSRVNGNDFNGVVDNDDLLLRRGHQLVRVLRLQTHRLDGVLHVTWLVVVRVAELCCPGAVSGQAVESRGELDKPFHGRIPGHLVGVGGALIGSQVHMIVEPFVSLGDLVGIGGCGKDLRDQRVRIEGDRGHKLIELHRVQFDIRRRYRSVGVHIRLRCGNEKRCDRERQNKALGLLRKLVRLEFIVSPFGVSDLREGVILGGTW